MPCNVSKQDRLSYRFDTLDAWLRWQEQLTTKQIVLGLDRSTQVAKTLELIPSKPLVISVAGTNGKGTCANLLNGMLLAAGYKVGCYTSPHLVQYNERIVLNGTMVDDCTIIQAFAAVDEARCDTPLTYFEFGTLSALKIFQDADVDIMVLEVGLGGRLDAVNILDIDGALISTIDYDHQEWLGNSREEIGREKAGIMRGGKPVVCIDRQLPASVTQHAETIAADIALPERDYQFRICDDFWEWSSNNRIISDLPFPSDTRLYLVENAAGVIMLLNKMKEKIQVSDQAIKDGIKNLFLPGRFQQINDVIPIVLDVAHNVQAAKTLCDSLYTCNRHAKNHFVVGMLKEKDHASFFKPLLSIAASWTLVDLPGARATSCRYLERILRSLGCSNISLSASPFIAVDNLRRSLQEGDRIVVTGSFHTVAAILDHNYSMRRMQ